MQGRIPRLAALVILVKVVYCRSHNLILLR
jgi:hypothetical protein